MKSGIVIISSILVLTSTVSGFVTIRPSSRIKRIQSDIHLSAAKKSAVDEDGGDGKENTDPAKRAALEGVLGRIEKSYGRGSIMKLGDAGGMIVESISTGALTLDAALGGGYPKGRVVEIYGPESSGKTTLALHAIAECQKSGGTAAFVDAEHALDPSYGKVYTVVLWQPGHFK